MDVNPYQFGANFNWRVWVAITILIVVPIVLYAFFVAIWYVVAVHIDCIVLAWTYVKAIADTVFVRIGSET